MIEELVDRFNSGEEIDFRMDCGMLLQKWPSHFHPGPCWPCLSGNHGKLLSELKAKLESQ
jgi:hypothetical protein